jgi:RNA polymerase sigma-70 factor (ECF subfamily)
MPHPTKTTDGDGEWTELWPRNQSVDIIETCRDYLLMAANKAVGSELRVKVAPSDLVQETMIAAVENFDQFRGTSERELLAWLTKILSYRIVDAARKFRRQKVDVAREVSMDDEARQIELSIVDGNGSPSALVAMQEEERRLTEAMNSLPAELAELVRLRNWEKMTFAEIGAKIGLSESGARKRWGEAIRQLRQRIG